MSENYKHLYEQTKKMLTMYQDELVPGYRKKIEELEKQIADYKSKATGAKAEIVDIHIPCRKCGKLIPAGGNIYCGTCRLRSLNDLEFIAMVMTKGDYIRSMSDD